MDVELTAGSPGEQTAVVQGRNFTGVVRITVVMTPETGASAAYFGELNMNSGNPAHRRLPLALFNVDLRTFASGPGNLFEPEVDQGAQFFQHLDARGLKMAPRLLRWPEPSQKIRKSVTYTIEGPKPLD